MTSALRHERLAPPRGETLLQHLAKPYSEFDIALESRKFLRWAKPIATTIGDQGRLLVINEFGLPLEPKKRKDRKPIILTHEQRDQLALLVHSKMDSILHPEGNQSKRKNYTLDEIQEMKSDVLETVYAAVVATQGFEPHLEQLEASLGLLESGLTGDGKIIQQRTGEGKTITIAMAAALAAMEGQGVHVFSANDELTTRDTLNMGRLYNALGLTCAVLTSDEQAYVYEQDTDDLQGETGRLRKVSAKEAFETDITYGLCSTVGFAAMWDEMATNSANLRLRKNVSPWAFCDEARRIMVKESTTPLIIEKQAVNDDPIIIKRGKHEYRFKELHSIFADIADALEPDLDFKANRIAKTVSLVDAKHAKTPVEADRTTGIDFIEEMLRRNIVSGDKVKPPILGNDQGLYSSPYAEALVDYIVNAIKARYMYKQDEDYVIDTVKTQSGTIGSITVLEELGGRRLEGRRFPGGLHGAIEEREKRRQEANGITITVKPETTIVAAMTLKQFFSRYKKIAGMDGAANRNAKAFREMYNYGVVTIPNHNKDRSRHNRIEILYPDLERKLQAIARQVLRIDTLARETHTVRPPILIPLKRIPHIQRFVDILFETSGGTIQATPLHAGNRHMEKDVILNAGSPGFVLVSNLADVGTDIVLGGDPTNPSFNELRQNVIRAGGLKIIGEHGTRADDDQTRGRGGRQGDPSEDWFFSSPDDLLFQQSEGEKGAAHLHELIEGSSAYELLPDGSRIPVIKGWTAKRILRGAQRAIESYDEDRRMQLIDDYGVIGLQREAILSDRQKVVDNDESLNQYIESMVSIQMGAIVHAHPLRRSGHQNDQQIQQVIQAVPFLASISRERMISIAERDVPELAAELKATETSDTHELDQLRTHFISTVLDKGKTDAKKILTDIVMDYVRRTHGINFRATVLGIVDSSWTNHLTGLEDLRMGIHFRSVGKLIPRDEFAREAAKRYELLQNAISSDILQLLRVIRAIAQKT